MAEGTDAARQAVFSFGQSTPVDLKGLLELCTRLPARSKAVGALAWEFEGVMYIVSVFFEVMLAANIILHDLCFV